MKITVRFRGPLANQMESDIIKIELAEESVLHDLLLNLISDNSSVKDVWKTPEQMDAENLMLCNEVDIGLSGGLKSELKDRDVLVILPLVHGG